MLIRVHARLSKNRHVPLKLLDLVQVMDERLRNLLHEQRAVRNVELDLRLDLVVRLLQVVHAVLGALHRLVAHLDKRLGV